MIQYYLILFKGRELWCRYTKLRSQVWYRSSSKVGNVVIVLFRRFAVDGTRIGRCAYVLYTRACGNDHTMCGRVPARVRNGRRRPPSNGLFASSSTVTSSYHCEEHLEMLGCHRSDLYYHNASTILAELQERSYCTGCYHQVILFSKTHYFRFSLHSQLNFI